jgi:hypothetical protein
MSYGLQVFDASGSLAFDSRTAAGGVCLGIFTVPASGGVFTFPEMGSGLQGYCINFQGKSIQGMQFDNNLGYPRFTFPNLNWPRYVALFVK